MQDRSPVPAAIRCHHRPQRGEAGQKGPALVRAMAQITVEVYLLYHSGAYWATVTEAWQRGAFITSGRKCAHRGTSPSESTRMLRVGRPAHAITEWCTMRWWGFCWLLGQNLPQYVPRREKGGPLPQHVAWLITLSGGNAQSYEKNILVRRP